MSTDDIQDGAPGEGERIAKVLSRAGVASRRDAERLILEGRVTVNGDKIINPATNVTAKDRLAVDGQPVAEAEATRIWLYHKPAGLVTTEADEEGRPTVFDSLPDDMPRVMSVGRLDITSEGLLLLTNDGEVKRKLELPSTGWSRRYRVRIHGTPTNEQLEPLRQGVTVDEMDYQPMDVAIDRQQGSNAWLTLTLREGKNREIRRVMEHLGFTVNRLIRISYGPFQLGELPIGDVEEVRPKIVRDQLGLGKPEPVARGRKRVGPTDMPVVDDKPEDRPERDRLSTIRPAGATVKRELKARAPRTRGEPAEEARPARPSRPDGPRRKAPAPGGFAKPRTWMRADEARAARDEAPPEGERPRRPPGDAGRSSGYKSHGRPARDGEDRPRGRAEGFRSHSAEGARARPPRDEGDRPRRDHGDRPQRAEGDRGPRRFSEDGHPPRRFDNDRPPRRSEGDDDRPRGPRPPREDRPARAYKPREGGEDRGPRPYKPARPAREGDEGRSPRSFKPREGGDRGPRPYKPARPAREGDAERPARFARPPRPESEERRPPRRSDSDGDRPARGFKPNRDDNARRPPRPPREGGDRRPPQEGRSFAPRGERPEGGRPPRKGPPREDGFKGRPAGGGRPGGKPPRKG